jgi:hypothetical protein
MSNAPYWENPSWKKGKIEVKKALGYINVIVEFSLYQTSENLACGNLNGSAWD